MKAPLALVGAGACTTLGRSLGACAAAVGAGIRHVGEHPFVANRVGRRVKMAIAEWLDIRLSGSRRYAALAEMAASEALEPLGCRDDARLHVFIGLPEKQRPGTPPDLEDALAHAVGGRADAVTTLSAGHAAATLALEQAARAIEGGEADLCLAGGVDSYFDHPTLAWLQAGGRLLTPGWPWGFTPGEGAGFCVLASTPWLEAHDIRAPLELLGAASAEETATIHSDAVCVGKGLSAAFEGALAPLRAAGERADALIGDLNGEPYRGDELGFALSRTADVLADPKEVLAPAAYWGDVGAASGALFAGLAFMAAARGRDPGETTLIFASSEGGRRGAALLRATSTRRQEDT